jgi:hypothetical protein
MVLQHEHAETVVERRLLHVGHWRGCIDDDARAEHNGQTDEKDNGVPPAH